MRMRVPVASLAESLGFAAVEVGKIAEGGRLIHARAPLVFQNLIKYPMWKVTEDGR
jgi:predicted dinucleotide-binding enzyme